MGLGVSLPSQEILQFLPLPMSSQSKDLFYFILRFIFNEVRWWFREVFPMFLHLLIWCEKGYVKGVEDLPVWWEF
jgi:hypothetical protein